MAKIFFLPIAIKLFASIIENGQWSADQDAQKKADTSLGALLQTADALDVKAKYLAHSRPRSYAKFVRRIRITRPA